MNFHPIANIWPMMTDAEIQRLADDIKEQGQLNPIWIYEDQILDGRNRFQACQLVGIAPRFEEYSGDNPVQFAFSQNEERRHLNSGQRAALAVEIKPQLEIEAKKRQIASGGDRKSEEYLANRRLETQEEYMAQKHISREEYERYQSEGASPEIRAITDKWMESVPQMFAEPIKQESRTEAAKIAGTNHAYVNAAEKIKETAPDIFEKLKAGNITMQDARREASRRPDTDQWLPDERERQQAIERGETVVANFERDKHLIHWASQNGKLQPVNRGTKWGNPFIMGSDGSRDDVCDNYATHYLPFKPSLARALPELKGKVLACHCYPERCHGDTLSEAIGE